MRLFELNLPDYREMGASMSECLHFSSNMETCNCTYEPCSRKGYCCQCVAYHRRLGELPACYFPDDVEKTYDRSVRKFIEISRKSK